MRKSIYFSAALAALFATSCSSDMVQPANGEGEGNVVLKLQLPKELSTRAEFGDGTTATRLQYAVYHNGDRTPIITDDATFVDLQATVALNLVNGQKYDFVFWADSSTKEQDATPESKYYVFNAATQEVTVNYANLNGNDEGRDAFFGQLTEVEITGPTTLSATLKRPFAQINLGTSDFSNTAVKAVYGENCETLTSSMEVTTTGLPTTLNLLDGTVDGETEQSVTFAVVGRPDASFGNYPVEDYEYVSMNYILVGTDKEVLDLSYTFNNGTTEMANLPLAAVPVQRNYRTNIYGAVLTSPTDLTITIAPAFEDPDHNEQVINAKDLVAKLNDPNVTEIKVISNIDLSNVAAEDLVLTTTKVINLTGSINLDPQKPFDIQDGGKLTINGGTLTNGQDVLGAGQNVSMFHVRKDGELNLNGVIVNGNTTHHYHGIGLNSALIDYWDNAIINVTDSRIVTGEFVVCGMGEAEGSKMNFTNSYMESTSSSGYGTNNWSYAFRLHGGEAIFKECTVVGIQGGVSGGRNATITIESGTYYTHNNEGKTDAFYAVYMTGNAKAIINGGYFYGAVKRSALAGEGGTSAVVCGDNDTNQPIGNIIINGGYFSGLPYNHVTNNNYGVSEGFKMVAIEEGNQLVDGRKYLWQVVPEEVSED